MMFKTLFIALLSTCALAQSPQGAFAAASGGAVATGPGAVSTTTGTANAQGAGSTAISDCSATAAASFCAPAEAQAICSANASNGGTAVDTQVANANTQAVLDCLNPCSGLAQTVCTLNRAASGFIIVPVLPCNSCPLVLRNVRVVGQASFCRCAGRA